MSRPSCCETAGHDVMRVLDPNLMNEFLEFERRSSSFFSEFFKARRNNTASWPFSAREILREDLVGEAID